MARQPSFEAVAGANTLNRVEDDVESMNRYRDAMLRQEQAAKRQEGMAQRAEKREQRVADHMALDDEVTRWKFEKDKALDKNSQALKIDLDKEAIEANQALRDIRTDAPDAQQKLADWRVKYFRQLDPDLGDKRLQTQYAVNEKFLNQITLERERSQRERADAAAKEAAKKPNYGTETIKDGDKTIKRPLPAPDSPEGIRREHDVLEAGLKGLKGDALAAQVAKLNPLKAKLGFELLDPKGQVVEKATVTPVATPAPSTPASTTPSSARLGDIVVGNVNGIPEAKPTATPAVKPAAATPALKAMPDDVMNSAKAAIQKGKDRAAVIKRLQENGYNPAGL